MTSQSENLKVTVLMSVYNSENYLREAIESILTQTFTDFEFIIINDFSTDNSMKIIGSYQDSRIRLVHNNKNLGLAASLNRGIDLANGEYIARMDSDDISLPTRLAKQVVFMDKNPNVGICGTWYKMFGESSGIVVRCSTDPAILKSGSLFNSMIGHSSVMMRKELLKKYNLYYDPSYKKAQDYELWSRASKKFDFANIGEILLLYRVHKSQMTQCSFDEQVQLADKVRLSLLKDLGIYPTEEEFSIHQILSSSIRMFLQTYRYNKVRNLLEKADKWLCNLKLANDKRSIYSEPAFSEILLERWFVLCIKFMIKGFISFKLVCPPEILKRSQLGYGYIFNFLFKSLITGMRYTQPVLRYHVMKK